MNFPLGLSAVAAAAILAGETEIAEIDQESEFTVLWLGDGPERIVQTYQFTCSDESYFLEFDRIARGSMMLTKFSIDGDSVSERVFSGLANLAQEFSEVDSLNFSCGNLYTGPNPHGSANLDFRGQVKIAFRGRRAGAPIDAEKRCRERGGVYVEQIMRTITVTKTRVSTVRGSSDHCASAVWTGKINSQDTGTEP